MLSGARAARSLPRPPPPPPPPAARRPPPDARAFALLGCNRALPTTPRAGMLLCADVLLSDESTALAAEEAVALAAGAGPTSKKPAPLTTRASSQRQVSGEGVHVELGSFLSVDFKRQC